MTDDGAMAVAPVYRWSAATRASPTVFLKGFSMNLTGAIAGAAVGGLIGAAAWVAIGYATGYELGILAVGVGLACGIGAAIGAKGRAGTQGGIAAAACAIVAIIAARLVLVEMAVDQLIREAMAEESSGIRGPEDDDFWTAFIADRIVQQREAAGEELDWPMIDEDDEGDALVANDYPADIWTEAQGKWQQLSLTDREAFCKVGALSILNASSESAAEFRGVASIIGALYANLHPMALVLMGIAAGGAFKVARNSRPVGEAELGSEQASCDAQSTLTAATPMSLPRPVPAARAAPANTGDAPVFGLPGMPPPSDKPRFPRRPQPPASNGGGQES